MMRLSRQFRWLLITSLTVASLVWAGWVAWLIPGMRLRARYESVHIEMTQAEVEAIMCPPGDWLLDKPVRAIVYPPPRSFAVHQWLTSYGRISVGYDNGKVVTKDWSPFGSSWLAPQFISHVP